MKPEVRLELPEAGDTGNKLLWWLLGFFATICLIGAGAWAESVGTRLGAGEQKTQTLENKLSEMDGKLDTLLGLMDQKKR